MKTIKNEKSLLRLSTAAMLAGLLVLAGCGGSGPQPTDPPATPSAYEMASELIQAAATEAAAQAAYDAVDQDAISGSERAKLMTELQTRLTALATEARIVDQKAALAMAAADVDTSGLSDAAAIAAANMAIAALQAALNDAVDVSDADKAMYQTMLDNAEADVRMAQTGLDTQGRMMAQRMAIDMAVTDARTKVNAVNDTSSDADVMAADHAVYALETAIANAADIPAGDTDVASAQGTHETLVAQLTAAKASRTAVLDKAKEAEIAAMAATALKLYNGISAPTADTDAAGNRFAQHAADPNVGDIQVSINDADDVFLSEDKDAMVVALHGWEGKKYTAAPTGGGTYEAVVYSNVGKPTMGLKFGSAAENDDYQYTLNNTANANQNIAANTELNVTGVTDYAKLVSGSRFSQQSAGKQEFKLPENTYRVAISGDFHGVSGTYYCVPTGGETCSATKAAEGFTLANGTWTFKAANNDTRIMGTPDAIYASYGWWLHKSADDKTYTASAFVSDKGEVPDATGLDTLEGTATYKGGAAGKYALQSSTGGTNDAGHFTAAATLEADFSDNSITGTIDTFTGADGESRDWSVELKEAAVAAGGAITRTGDGEVDNDTAWTIGGTAAAASGEWSGSLQDNGEVDGVPKVGSGTFYTTYGSDGKMVGGFGVNKQ